LLTGWKQLPLAIDILRTNVILLTHNNKNSCVILMAIKNLILIKVKFALHR